MVSFVVIFALLVWSYLVKNCIISSNVQRSRSTKVNIAICDDDVTMMHLIEDESKKYFEKQNTEVEFLLFQNGESLISAVKQKENSIDILLLDIDMPGMSGFEVAKILRETCEELILIFITSHEMYVYDSFEYRPFRYIRKSKLKTELPLALRAAYSLCLTKVKKYVTVEDDAGEYILELSKISYFEINGRKIDIHLTDGRMIHAKKTMKAFYKEVQEKNFVKIYEGCAVNIQYIKGYLKDEIILDNGEKLLTSREGMKKVKKELAKYWSKLI